MELIRLMSKLTFYYAAMNSGKSANLLLNAHEYQERDIRVHLWSYNSDKIKSRIGIEKDCKSFKDNSFKVFYKNILENINILSVEIWEFLNLEKIFIDEAQFLTKEQILDLVNILDYEIDIDCYGLRTDFQGNLFEGSKWLMAWADEIQEIKSVGMYGYEAKFQIRLDENGQRVWNGPQVDIGHHYETCSREVFNIQEAQKYVE